MTSAPVRSIAPPLAGRAREAARAAGDFLFRIQRADHWCAELESNPTITAEYVLLRQALGLDLAARAEATTRYLLSRQHPDGSWGIGHGLPGDVSTAVECYLALRLLGRPRDDEPMLRAERFIRAAGGIARVRVFTRINLALFGLFPWDAVPSVPPEIILLPPWSAINIYRLSSWARSTMVPLFILFHHRPVFALPGGRSPESGWLDHLWLDPAHKHVPYRPSVAATLLRDGPGWKAFFNAGDALLRAYEGLREAGPLPRLRQHALRACERWVLEHQEESGDWAGIFPPMLNGVLALHLAGHPLDSDPVRRGLEAIERFGIEDGEGFRVEACQSPVWDSALSLIALADAGQDGRAPRLAAVRRWIERKQILEDHGDWKVYNRRGAPGGWSFEHANTWYPDVDDTAAVLLAFLKGDPSRRGDEVVRRGAAWMVSMQNRDGGWAAFDVQNDRTFLNQIPFSDMDSLCDPSSPDVTGRVLEALGALEDPRWRAACRRGLAYLRGAQEPEGSFYGRWGVNYVYGTSNVLCGLARQRVPGSDPMVARALRWLASVQNADGGFGEGLDSYADRAAMGRGPSTASQTAWGVMGLLAYRPPEDEAVARGVAWLVDRQLDAGPAAGSWEEAAFTGTGFPRHFYLRYHLYRHYFPLMALGRFCAASGA
ncbi:squalene--hopene cyclase [Anaeromyxobacter diazotrophicus]|uniref:Squalene-hopene cyclase n=1 Tax=Anaeromyxobacter diazotrophicus TaxID=2590199 RepID=A0A7I9VP02_9BACT|nr:squalene--hopene cyclase [Anaeromyxobacter diazotrophicus]GEJ58133.1 squalene-hopene cyclase [Anaeromyxobacter diazotrophicus]